MNIDEMLGINVGDPAQALARDLVSADSQLLDDLVRMRTNSGLTQEDVARSMGVSQPAVARIESGERDPHLSTLRRYAHAVGARVTHEVRAAKAVASESTSEVLEHVALVATWREHTIHVLPNVDVPTDMLRRAGV